MARNKKKGKLIERLRNKYRLTVYNDKTFEEVWSLRLSQLNIFSTVGITLILLMGLAYVLLVFTPLQRFLPVHPDSRMQREIIQMAGQLDTLEYELTVRDRYIHNLKNIIEGKAIDDEGFMPTDTSLAVTDIDFQPSAADSLLREQIEENEMYDLTPDDTPNTSRDFSSMHFYAPINKGMITNKFNIPDEHFGVDIVAETNEPIMSVLDGTVITATWTLATGYVISVQHENDLITFYKHNSALLKKVGDNVKAGEVIAIIGNSGELTTGPHLHFELWHKGIPLNPEDYIVF